MADYKMVNTTKLDAAMTATADKIRAGTGKSDKITWKEDNGFADDIPDGVEQATPTIDVDDDGKITASSTQGGGIVKSGLTQQRSSLKLRRQRRSHLQRTIRRLSIKADTPRVI